MRKAIFILSLILAVSNFALSQNNVLQLGKGTITYDNTNSLFRFSNKLTLSNGGSIINFNPDQFTWSLSTGLNLRNLVQDTNFYVQKITIHRDTTMNEASYTRQYIINKPYYNHIYDLYELQAEYKAINNGVTVEDKTFNLINNAYTIFDDQNLNADLTSKTIYVPCSPPNNRNGQFLFIIDFNYEFSTDDKEGESKMNCILYNSSTQYEFNNQNYSFCYNDNYLSGRKDNGKIISSIENYNGSNIDLSVKFQGTSASGTAIILKTLRIIAILLH